MSRKGADVARRAAEIIQQRGKATGHLTDEAGGVCYLGALFRANDEARTGQTLTSLGILTCTGAALRSMGLTADFVKFNDDPDTDERDVAKLLLQVADRLEVAP